MNRSTVGALSSQLWRRLLPIAFVTYSFVYLDRSNYSLGAVGGLTHDLHIAGGAAFVFMVSTLALAAFLTLPVSRAQTHSDH